MVGVIVLSSMDLFLITVTYWAIMGLDGVLALVSTDLSLCFAMILDSVIFDHFLVESLNLAGTELLSLHLGLFLVSDLNK